MFILQNKKIMASKIHVDTFMQFSHMILSSLLLDSSKKNKMSCVDCKASSSKPVCDSCLKKRRPCATQGCTTKLNPLTTYVYCKSCACTFQGCYNAHLESTKYCYDHNVCKRCYNQRLNPESEFCKPCETQWKREAQKCVMCRKK